MAIPDPVPKSYYETVPVTDLTSMTREQLKIRISDLQKEKEILNRELKSKQIVIDIKSKQAERLSNIVKLFLDTAALGTMIMEGKKKG